MKKIRLAIIDDDPNAITLLAHYAELDDRLQLVFTETDSIRGLRQLRKLRIELLLLDEHMPEIKGSQIARLMKGKMTIVFVTGHPEAAQEAFNIGLVDCIPKPVQLDRFMQAIERALAKWTGQPMEKEKPTAIYLKKKGENSQYRIVLADIVWIEVLNNESSLHFVDRSVFASRIALKELALLLPSDDFVQIHQSYIVAKEMVTKLDLSNWKIHLYHTDRTFIVSHSYRDAVKNNLANKIP